MQTIITLCDLCDDGATRAAPVVVALGERAPARVLDLCPRHHEDLIDPLEAALAELGRDATPGPPTEEDPPYSCIACGYEIKTVSGLTMHLKSKHDMATTLDVYGSSRCLVCGEDQGTIRTLGAHSRSHGVEGAHGLYRAALDAGDPHDLIAKRKAELGIQG